MRRRQIIPAQEALRRAQNEERAAVPKDSEEAPVAAVKRKRGRPRKVKDDDAS